MKYKCTKYKDVTFIEIFLNKFKVTLSTLGASIYEIDRNGDVLTLTPSKYDDFLKDNIYHGKTIGPVANRIKNAELKIDDNLFCFTPNENNNLLHSGIHGFSNTIFEYEICEINGDLLVIFSTFASNSYDGFPGERSVKITYKISENGSLNLLIIYDVFSDAKTLLKMTNHTYFNLGEQNIGNLSLKVPSKFYIRPDDNDLLPISKEQIIDCLDFSDKKKLSDAINNEFLKKVRANGIDHFIYFDSHINDVRLSLESTKYLLELKTDFEGVQLYSDNYEDNVSYKSISTLKNRGLAIEPSDSHLDYNLTQVYQRYISYKISLK